MFSNHKLNVSVVVAVLLVLQAPAVFAQRQIPTQMEISFSANPFVSMGGSAEWAMYGFPGRFFCGLNYQAVTTGDLCNSLPRMNRNGSYIDESMKELDAHDTDKFVYDRMRYNTQDAYASVGYLFRVLSTRSRSITLFLGAACDVGMRFLAGNPSSIIYKTEQEDLHRNDIVYEGYQNDYKSNCFTFGISPRAEVEFFPFKKVSVSLFCKPRIVLVNPYGQWLNFQAGAGVNFYLVKK